MVIGIIYSIFKLTDIICYGHANINWFWVVVAVIELLLEVFTVIWFYARQENGQAQEAPNEAKKAEEPRQIKKHQEFDTDAKFAVTGNPYVPGTVRYQAWEESRA